MEQWQDFRGYSLFPFVSIHLTAEFPIATT